MMITKYFKKPSFFFILIFSSFLSVFFNYFFSVRFEENDDVLMLLILSGKYTGSLDNHLVFINFIFASLLNLFYAIIPKIEWYTISLIFLNTIAISILAKLILESSYATFFKVVLLIFLYSIFFNLSLTLQFTRTAVILSIAGLSVLYNTKYKFIGALVFTLGSLLRFEAVILILLISLPLFISLRELKNLTLSDNFRMVIITLFISIFFKIADHAYYYLDPEWRSYLVYNKLRGKINDNPNAKLSNFMLPNDISLEDYSLLLNFHTNPPAITYDKLEQVYELFNGVPLTIKIFNILAMLKYFKYQLFIIALLTILFVYQNKNKKIKIAFTFFIFLGLISYISLNGSVKERIFYPSFLAVTIFLIFLNEKLSFAPINLIIFIIIILFSGYLLNYSYRYQRFSKKMINTYNRQSALIGQYVAGNKKLVTYQGDYGIEFNNPFRISSTFSSQKIFFSGWLNNSPFNKNKFDSFTYYINGYGLFTNINNVEYVSYLICGSILKQNNIKVLPKTVLSDQYNSIIEFRIDSTEASY
jgi:hypothetical protein